MNVYLNIFLIVTTLCVVALIIYLVKVLIQLRKTLESVDELAQQINTEVIKVDETLENIRTASGHVKEATGKVASFPFLKGIGFLPALLKGLKLFKDFSARKKAKKEK